MHFQKIFSLSFILLFFLNIFGCSANIEGCLEDGNCGPAIVVSEFEGNLSDDPFDSFWSSGQVPASITIELGPQMIRIQNGQIPLLKRFRSELLKISMSS